MVVLCRQIVVSFAVVRHRSCLDSAFHTMPVVYSGEQFYAGKFQCGDAVYLYWNLAGSGDGNCPCYRECPVNRNDKQRYAGRISLLDGEYRNRSNIFACFQSGSHTKKKEAEEGMKMMKEDRFKSNLGIFRYWKVGIGIAALFYLAVMLRKKKQRRG